jgi:hypothetical protein
VIPLVGIGEPLARRDLWSVRHNAASLPYQEMTRRPARASPGATAVVSYLL